VRIGGSGKWKVETGNREEEVSLILDKRLREGVKANQKNYSP